VRCLRNILLAVLAFAPAAFCQNQPETCDRHDRPALFGDPYRNLDVFPESSQRPHKYNMGELWIAHGAFAEPDYYQYGPCPSEFI
jgi:hypothetical protein